MSKVEDHYKDDDDFVADATTGDESEEESKGESPRKKVSFVKELAHIDRMWYSRLSPRWMDLVGDYAGMEPFVIDGDSLCETIIKDRLLALGRDDDISFQIMHAYWSTEKLLSEFVKCQCVFDVVFFLCNYELSECDDRTGPYHEYMLSSRRLTRSLIRRHIATIPGISVLTFKDQRDPLWKGYVSTRKPLFIMCNDGGHPSSEGPNREAAASRAFFQRIFIYRALASGVAVASLEAAEFRDSKILTLIYEHRRGRNDRSRASGASSNIKQETVGPVQPTQPTEVAAVLKPPTSLGAWIGASTEFFLSELKTEHSTPVTYTLVYLFLIHMFLLPSITIEHRAQNTACLHTELIETLRSDILPPLFDALLYNLRSKLLPDPTWRADVDIRIFLRLLEFILSSKGEPDLESLVGLSVVKEVEAVWSKLVAKYSVTIDLTALRIRFPTPIGEAQSPTSLSDREGSPSFPRVLPFQNHILDEHLRQIHVDIEDDPSNTYDVLTSDPALRNFANSSLVIHEDNQHWHNRKPLIPRPGARVQQKRTSRTKMESELSFGFGGGVNSQRILTPEDWLRMKLDRKNQQKLSRIRNHAESLMGAKGGPLTRISIAPTRVSVASVMSKRHPDTKLQTKRQNRQEHSGSSSSIKKGGRNGGEPNLTSAEKLRIRIQAEKAGEVKAEMSRWWKTFLISLSGKSAESQRADLDAVNKKRLENPWIKNEVLLYRLHLEVSEWAAESQADSTMKVRHIVTILTLIKEIASSTVQYPAAVTWLRNLLDLLGFGQLCPFPAFSDRDSAAQKMSFAAIKVSSRSSSESRYPFMRMDHGAVEFQLNHFGQYMDRSMDSLPDSRVSFHPDAWQRKTLDLIDSRSSILVVAPTSAGKTFISFYAMEQVLRESDDGIVVYVAPTKALVNQMLAETVARFSKDLKSGTLWAADTREIKINDPLKTQILITVPDILATMLLSPSMARVWTPRIRWIILDEIHSIGQQEGGIVWEQLILMAPCPIIGLSATIGNVKEFNRWLGSVQEQHGFTHALVEHKHRYSHLRKFYYPIPDSPPSSIPPIGTHLDAPSRLKFIHPISVLDTGDISLPEDFALESRDCASLYAAMKVAAQDDPSKMDDLLVLSPSVFFEDFQSEFLRQKDVFTYEAALKDCLQKWISTSQNPADIIKGVANLLSIETTVDDYLIPSPRRVYSNLLPLLNELHNEGCLPVIMFNFDRNATEKMAEVILDNLTEAESEWRKSSPEWNKKVNEWRAWKADEKRRAQEMERAAKLKPELRGDPQEHTWHASFREEDPSPEFSFAGIKYGREKLEEDIAELFKKQRDWAIPALKRGIAVHHAGMPVDYRSLVERLFRLGLVRVMISTGTMALGINAPCKTVVFFTDSPYLTALSYRQCSGRAGRRGFDLLGNVVFYGLPIDRVYRLMMSKIPPLTGNVPLSTTLSLRLCNLLHGSQNAEFATGAVSSILALPQLSVSSEAAREEILHQFRFSLDYLQRSGFLDPQGRPLRLFPIAGHLYYTEPSNLALAHLIREGVLHKICETVDTKPQSTIKNLALLLCHLFGRRYVPKVIRNEARLRRLRGGGPSRILLPPMQESARKALLKHNQDILQIFRGYTYTYARQYKDRLGPDDKLPLSGDAVLFKNNQTQPSPFISYLKSRANVVTTVSAFVAISGQVDKSITTVEDLIRTARSVLHLNKQTTPSMGHLLGNEDTLPLNAYIWDFLHHGQEGALHRYNMIRKGDIWYALQDFSLALATLQMGIENLMKGRGDEDVDEIDDSSGSEDVDEDETETNEATSEPLPKKPQRRERGSTIAFPYRPGTISDADWKLYRAVVLLRMDFLKKWKPTWA